MTRVTRDIGKTAAWDGMGCHSPRVLLALANLCPPRAVLVAISTCVVDELAMSVNHGDKWRRDLATWKKRARAMTRR